MGQIGLLRGVIDNTKVAQETITTVGASGNTVDFAVSAVDSILVTVAVSSVPGTIQFFWETKDANGNYFVQWTSNSLAAAGNAAPDGSIGAGCRVNESCGAIGRLRWAVTGGAATFQYCAYGA